MTTLVGVAVEGHFSVFGTAGAITFPTLSGVLLSVLLPGRTPSRRSVPTRPKSE